MRIRRFVLGTHFEHMTGACTALSVGDLVLLSGVYPVDDFGVPFSDPDIYKQTVRCAQTVSKLCEQMHLDKPIVVRVRVYVTPGEDPKRIFRALYDGFAEQQPVMSVLNVHSHVYDGVKIMLECDISSLG